VVLVDAGLKVSLDKGNISISFDRRKQKQLVLTHSHFDHVVVQCQQQKWIIPVYAHHFEIPYLTGQIRLSSPDPTVGGSLMLFDGLLSRAAY